MHIDEKQQLNTILIHKQDLLLNCPPETFQLSEETQHGDCIFQSGESIMENPQAEVQTLRVTEIKPSITLN